MTVETIPTAKTKKTRRTPTERDADLFAKRGEDICEAVAEWRRINDEWANEPGDEPPGLPWFTAAANVIAAYADGPLPPWARRGTNSVSRLANELCRLGGKQSLDWNGETPTGPMLECLSFVEKVISERDPAPPEFETPGSLALIEGAAGTKVNKSQMEKICKMTAAEVNAELKDPGSVCNDEWKKRREAAWRAEREAEAAAEPDSHVLAGLVGQLASIGLE